jgi:uncharacterized protein
MLYPNMFLVRDAELGVIYSPLLGKFFSVNLEGLELIDQFIKAGMPPDHEFHAFLAERGFFQEVELPRKSEIGSYAPRELTMSVTSACNLRCIYCYALTCNVFTDLPWQIIEISIQQMYEYARKRKDKEVELSFHGTGETTVRWDVMVKAVNYALSILPNGWNIKFTLVTNGTLIDDEKAMFLAKHNFSVVLSIDGMEKVQNQLRPKADGTGSFTEAINGAKALVRHNVYFAMRSTITGINQDDMLDFLELCASIGCKEISVAPFSLTGRGENGVPDIDAPRFIKCYIETKRRAKELGVIFSMPSDYLDNASARYCNADGESFAIMPDGQISCCTRVTRSDDSLADIFFIGEVTQAGVSVNEVRLAYLKLLNLYNFSECTNCFAKFTCAGGCHHTRLISGNRQPQNYCEIMQGVLWNTLKEAALGQ